jgi:hypothetical protein
MVAYAGECLDREVKNDSNNSRVAAAVLFQLKSLHFCIPLRSLIVLGIHPEEHVLFQRECSTRRMDLLTQPHLRQRR